MSEVPQPPLADKIQDQFVAQVEGKGVAPEMARDIFAGVLPKEGELPDAIAGIALAAARGKDYVSQLLQTGDYWKNRVETIGNRLKSEPGHEAEVGLIAELLQVVAEVVPTEMAARTEAGEVEELAGGIRDYVSERVLARLTDPEQPAVDRGRFQWEYDEKESSVLARLGVSDRSPLYQASVTSPDRMATGSEGYIKAQRARQKAYTEILAARFLQGVPVQTEWVDRNGYIKKDIFTRPTGMTDEVAKRYATALAATIENLGRDTNWDPAQYEEQRQKLGGFSDPITIVHEQFESRLFDGMRHQGKLPVGDQSQAISFARGKALQTIIEGGDIETYLTTLSAIPAEKGYMADIARQTWESLPTDSPLRRNLGEILLTAHTEELREPQLADFRNTVIEAMGGAQKVDEIRKAVAERVVSGARSQIEATMIGRSLDVFIDGMKEDTERGHQEAAATWARQAIFGQVISGIAAGYLQPVAGQFIAGQVPLTDVAAQAARIQEALAKLDLMKASEVRDRTGNTMKLTLKPELHYGSYGVPKGQYEVPQEFHPLVAQANLARELLAAKYSNNEWYYIHTIGAYFKQAQEFGLDKKSLINLHNQIAISLVAANNMIADRFGPNPYRGASLPFIDVLLVLGPGTTGAQAEQYTAFNGFQTFNHDGKQEFKGYWTYRAADEQPDRWGGDYLRQERNAKIEDRVRGSLEPVLDEGVKLAGVRRLLKDEKLMERGDLLAKAVDAGVQYGNLVGYGPKQEYQRDEVVRTNAETAAKLAQNMTALEADLKALDELRWKESSFGSRINDWENNDLGPASSSKIAKIRYNLGQGDVASKRKAIEAEMSAFAGVKCEIGDPAKRQQALKAVAEAAQRKRAEKAQAIAGQMGEIMGPVNGISARVNAFLGERTTPAYDPANPNQVVDKLRVPAIEGEGKAQRVSDKEIDLATEDFGLLVPLLRLFVARDRAMTTPLRGALDQLMSQRYFPDETAPLAEAVKAVSEKMGDDREVLTVLAATLRTLITGAIGAKLDRFSMDTFIPQNLGNKAMRDAFQAEINRIKSDLEARKPRTSAV